MNTILSDFINGITPEKRTQMILEDIRTEINFKNPKTRTDVSKDRSLTRAVNEAIIAAMQLEPTIFYLK